MERNLQLSANERNWAQSTATGISTFKWSHIDVCRLAVLGRVLKD